uniref:Uncharacterized protein n=1 Tax=Rhipicephalus zambeziensis TaxID=60191 RepID=A0A224Y7C7_9ACAR
MLIDCSRGRSTWTQMPKSASRYKVKGENCLYPVRKQTGHRLREGCVSGAAVLSIAADVVEVSRRGFWPRTRVVRKLFWSAVRLYTCNFCYCRCWLYRIIVCVSHLNIPFEILWKTCIEFLQMCLFLCGHVLLLLPNNVWRAI